jgi:heme/copper-type cytochrome/quinol oxidase subunit 2
LVGSKNVISQHSSTLLVIDAICGLGFLSFQFDTSRAIWSSFAHFAEHHDKAIVAIGTALLAVFTVVLAVVTVFLWRATRDLVEDAKDTGERQLLMWLFRVAP